MKVHVLAPLIATLGFSLCVEQLAMSASVVDVAVGPWTVYIIII